MIDAKQIRPKIDFTLLCGEYPDAELKAEMVSFLREVEKRGSLNAASKVLHMSYPRSLSILKQLEDSLGTTLVERVRPDGSRLTDDGRRLLDIFEQSQQQMVRYANEAVKEVAN